MKKSLVLAMAMALGVTASAYAANPFSDVPAGHWAYDSVAKLAAAGVVDGYADGAFDGDKLMTRYEMAQIVAKAMAKGADCDKLAAEFADELDTLGVRVAKLEKGADAVKIAGQIRYNYKDCDVAKKSQSRIRTRLVLKGAINEDWTYTGRFENNQYHHGYDSTNKVMYGAAGEDKVELNWAYVSGKIGGVKADIGRQDFKLYTGAVVDTRFDGIKAAYGKDIKVTGYVGKGGKDLAEGGKFNANGVWEKRYASESEDRFYALDVATKLGVVDAHATFYKYDAELENEIWAVGVAMPLAKGLSLTAEYLKGDAQAKQDDNGWVAGVKFGGAKASAPGSWGVYANYFDQPAATYFYNSIESNTTLPSTAELAGDGFKGYEVGVNYALAKNIVAAVKYYDMEARENSADTAETLWGEVLFTF